MKEVQYRNMTIEELIANWEIDDGFQSYKDTLIQKLIEENNKLTTEIMVMEYELRNMSGVNK